VHVGEGEAELHVGRLECTVTAVEEIDAAAAGAAAGEDDHGIDDMERFGSIPFARRIRKTRLSSYAD
jgi:hypothetical protein